MNKGVLEVTEESISMDSRYPLGEMALTRVSFTLSTQSFVEASWMSS